MSNMPVQTIPTGCVHLVFHRADQLCFSSKEYQPKNFLRGQLSVPDSLTPAGNINMIAVVFNSLGITPFISCPISALYNQYVDIENLEDGKLNRLKDLISSEEDDLICIQQIEAFLLRRLSVANEYNYRRIANSVETIKNQIQIDVSTLAQDACLGYRQFKRLFTDYVGMSPKEYSRVVRFQRALYTLQNTPDIEITQLAYTCGFYDHPHLVKDFRSLSGCSPTEYLSSRVSYSTLFSHNCKLNLIRAK